MTGVAGFSMSPAVGFLMSFDMVAALKPLAAAGARLPILFDTIAAALAAKRAMEAAR